MGILLQLATLLCLNGIVSFLWEVVVRAGTLWKASMGTTGLAVAVGYAKPLWTLLRQAFSEGWRSMKSHLIDTAKNGALITVIIWLILYSYDLMQVRAQINAWAETVSIPKHTARFIPPTFW